MKTTLNRREFLRCVGAGAAALAAAQCSNANERPTVNTSAEKPNILLIVSDDQG